MEDRGPDDRFGQLRPSADEEEAEQLLRRFGEMLSVVEETELYLLHNRCIARQDGSEEETTILEVIEGQIALRELRHQAA